MNHFFTDTEAEIAAVMDAVQEAGAKVVFTDVFLKGGEGGKELAKAVVEACDIPSKLHYSYDLNDSVVQKIIDVATKIYGADGVKFTDEALEKIGVIERSGYGNLPVIIAKTQYSLSDNKDLVGRPTHFTITVRDVILKGGAGFIVAVTGTLMLMPGLSKHPAAERIDIDDNGVISGLS